jgi:hypothetical protein
MLGERKGGFQGNSFTLGLGERKRERKKRREEEEENKTKENKQTNPTNPWTGAGDGRGKEMKK